MSEYKMRVTSISIYPADHSKTDMETKISISDEGGEFITISQNYGAMMIEINPDEWPIIRSAINRLMRLCK